MRAIIETYRGWEIYFDTDREEFYTVSNDHDKQETKKSYSSSKKFIDEYIKENSDFKPIKVMNMGSIYSDSEIITLIGIRKDKAFMYTDYKGNKRKLSSYSEKDYFLIDSRNDELFNQIKELVKQAKEIDETIKSLKEKVIKVTVFDIKKNLLGE